MQQPLNNSVCYLLKTIYLNYVYHLLKQSFSLLAKVLPLKKTNQWFFEKNLSQRSRKWQNSANEL